MSGARRAIGIVAASLLVMATLATTVVAAPGDEPDPTSTTTTEPTTTTAPGPTTTTAPAISAVTTTSPVSSTTPDVPAATTSIAPTSTLVPGDDPIDTTPVATTTTEPPFVILLTPDPTNSIAIDKTNTADGEPAGDDTTAQPGDTYTYNLTASCSSIDVSCVDLTVVDTFPPGVVVNSVCPDTATRDRPTTR